MTLFPPFSRPLVATTLALVALAGCGGGSEDEFEKRRRELVILGLLNQPPTTPPTTPPPTSSTTPPDAVNTAPVSNAGAALNGKTGVAVTLDGSTSSDANGDKLNYSWTLVSKPDGSNASLAGTTSATPTFTPDVSGTYVASLIVNDGKVDSAASTVSITIDATQAIGFDSIPSPLPAAVVSFPFAAATVHTLGQGIALAAGTPRVLKSIDLVMQSYACENGVYTDTSCSTTAGSIFTHPITMNLRDANGALIATKKQEFAIPYRPSSSAVDCPADPTRWKAPDGNCYSSFAFTIAFDMSDLKQTLPEAFIFEVAFETSRDGLPLGDYDNLNVGATNTPPTIGSATKPGYVIQNGVEVFDDGYQIMGRVVVSTP